MQNKLQYILDFIFIRICVIVLSITLIFSGFVKAIDPLGMLFKIQGYLNYWHAYIPENSVFLKLFVAILSIFEFMLGISLFLGIRKKITTICISMFFLIMTMFTIYTFVANPVSDCGCFGEAIKLSNGESLLKNIVLLICSFFLLLQPKKIKRIITERNQWTSSIWAFVYIVGLLFYSYHYTPIIDFTPWKLRKSIRKAYNGDDNTHEGKELSTFVVYNQGEDLTDKILNDKGYSFILTLPNPHLADDGNADRINDLYDFCQDHQIVMCALSTPSEIGIRKWKDRTGASYPIYTGESDQLKAMVRSNPGLVLLHHGRIINKWGNNELPDVDVLSTDNKILQSNSENINGLIKLILTFFIPLIIFITIDRIWVFKRLNLYKYNYEKKNCSRKLENES